MYFHISQFLHKFHYQVYSFAHIQLLHNWREITVQSKHKLLKNPVPLIPWSINHYKQSEQPN